MAQARGSLAQLASAALAMALTATTGCGSSERQSDATDGEEPCWGLTAPMPNPQSHAERACNRILEHRTTELDDTFGAYSGGEIPVYAGTVTATDSLGGELSGAARAQIVRGDYVGVLAMQGPGALLQIVVPGSNRWVTVGQSDADPGVLVVGTVLEWDAWGGPQPTTSAGSVRLGDSPDTLELDLSAAATDPAGTTYTASLEFHLTKLAPSEFGASLLLEFPNPMLHSYELAGDELRRITHESGIGYSAERPADYTGTGTCGYGPDYSIEQYVKLDDISSYGVRDAVLHDNSIYCGTCRSDSCTFDYERELGTK